MEDGVEPFPEAVESNEKTLSVAYLTPGLTEDQQMAMNSRRWLEKRKQTNPEEFDEDGNYLTWQELDARDNAAREARLAKLYAEDNPTPPKALARGTLVIPQGNVADLLEQQVAICSGLIGNVAEFVSGDTHPESCFPFMDRIARLMSSSAKAGRTIGQLRGIASEAKQTYVKQKEDRGVGGG